MNVSMRLRLRLKQIDYDGGFEYSLEVEVFVEVTGGYYLSENHPNPFNPGSPLIHEQQFRVEVFDVLGRRVALLYDGALVGEATHAFRSMAPRCPVVSI